MTDYLFYLQIWVFLCGIVIKKSLQVVNEVVLVIRNLQICHHYIVRSVRPVALSSIEDPVRLTRKVQTLQNELAVLLKQWAPLYRCNRPIEDILVNKLVKTVVVLTPLDYRILLTYFHLFAGIIISIIPSLYIAKIKDK